MLQPVGVIHIQEMLIYVLIFNIKIERTCGLQKWTMPTFYSGDWPV